VAPFVGFAGLAVARFKAHFTPCVEVAWRLAFEHWGCGYATEAARIALGYGFWCLAFSKVVSFTTATNHRSRAVMERLGCAAILLRISTILRCQKVIRSKSMYFTGSVRVHISPCDDFRCGTFRTWRDKSVMRTNADVPPTTLNLWVHALGYATARCSITSDSNVAGPPLSAAFKRA
jgi:Acetyltransferase (GNAT) domain